jgi:hypothetical protein
MPLQATDPYIYINESAAKHRMTGGEIAGNEILLASTAAL